ncbi:hypothetical protein M4D57_18725 [Brevibacillus borstelensis]|uniref:hypothetical protein n=1 Tax=Brevibacillus borstelensis TaxID=45462 RepID=UPI002040FD18|nr:hypothetical protein [Brevibacillus borstelensis]MCM3560604.1 hypothetical protein [Brevibacillus borstelensis]
MAEAPAGGSGENSKIVTGNDFPFAELIGLKGVTVMLEKLILEGEKFENQAVEINYGADKMISGLEFETWVSKAILYLERNYANSSLTKKAIEINKELRKDSYQKYHFLLGVLKAAKEIEDDHVESMSSFLD